MHASLLVLHSKSEDNEKSANTTREKDIEKKGKENREYKFKARLRTWDSMRKNGEVEKVINVKVLISRNYPKVTLVRPQIVEKKTLLTVLV